MPPDRSDWTDKRIDDKFGIYDDAIKGLADLPKSLAIIAVKQDELIEEVAQMRKDVREAANRRATIVVALIGAFALIASSSIGVLVVVLQHKP